MSEHETHPTHDFTGLQGMVWFTGVVEDRQDPKKLGRVRVRIWGTHCKEKQANDATGQGIPTEELPWSWVMKSTDSSSMDGIGHSTNGLVEGTWVVGISRDGQLMNDTIVIGTLGGIPEDPPQDKQGKVGFVDPRSAGEIASSPRYVNPEKGLDPGYPPQQIPMGRYPQEKHLGEPDINRLARAEKLDETYLKTRADNRKRSIPIAEGGKWDEKGSAYGAKYPYNHVFESESGHVVEFDDTPHKERVAFWHRSGTYLEIDKDGNVQMRSQGDYYEVSLKDRRIYAGGQIDMTADKGMNLLTTSGHTNIENQGSGITIHSDTAPITVKTPSQVTVEAGGQVTVQAGGQVTVRAGGLVSVLAAGAVNVGAIGPVTIESAVSVALVAPLCTANGQPIATT